MATAPAPSVANNGVYPNHACATVHAYTMAMTPTVISAFQSGNCLGITADRSRWFEPEVA